MNGNFIYDLRPRGLGVHEVSLCLWLAMVVGLVMSLMHWLIGQH